MLTTVIAGFTSQNSLNFFLGTLGDSTEDRLGLFTTSYILYTRVSERQAYSYVHRRISLLENLLYRGKQYNNSGNMSGEKKRGGRPRKEQKRVRVDTYMDPELAQRLFDHCRRTGFSYSKIIEIAVKAHLDEVEGPYAKEERERIHIQFDEKGKPHYPGEE